MKNLLSLTLLLVMSASTLFAQDGAKKNRKSPHETINGKNISITYGRPYKKGRDIFGVLEPYGKVYRTGADEATEITLKKNCVFGGKQLKAGTYTLFTIPGKDEFGVILNSVLNQWGAFGYDKVKDKNVLNITVPVKHLDNPVEQLTFTIKDNGIQFEWDKTSIFIPVKF